MIIIRQLSASYRRKGNHPIELSHAGGDDKYKRAIYTVPKAIDGHVLTRITERRKGKRFCYNSVRDEVIGVSTADGLSPRELSSITYRVAKRYAEELAQKEKRSFRDNARNDVLGF